MITPPPSQYIALAFFYSKIEKILQSLISRGATLKRQSSSSTQTSQRASDILGQDRDRRSRTVKDRMLLPSSSDAYAASIFDVEEEKSHWAVVI